MSHRATLKNYAFQALTLAFLLIIFDAVRADLYAEPRVAQAGEPEIFSRCWDYKLSPNLGIVPVVDSSAVYIVDSENNLLAIDPGNASRIWSSELGGEVVSNIILSDSSILLATNSQTTESNSVRKTSLRSISRATGITEWRVDIRSSDNAWIGTYPAAVIVVGEGGAISALTRLEGRIIWQRDIASPVTAEPRFGRSGVVLGNQNKEILNVSLTDGSSRQLWKSEFLPTALLVDASGRLVVGDERGSVIAISADGDRSWTFRNGARISSVLLDGSDYLASSNDNFIYKLSRSGNVKWKRRLPGRLTQAPLLLNDVAVMSVAGGGGVFVITQSKGKILNHIEIAEEVSSNVAASPDSKNMIIASPSGVAFFSREKCPAK
ncbi:MAG: hypothetical protein DMF63_18410 [Acidobacteria bacterium]|nr:MAG: hypothetical protein DMF63_18410 [Acidobacteriota bacterium]